MMNSIKLTTYAAMLITLQAVADSGKSTFGLERAWSTEQILSVPESVLYDAEREVIYITNINGGALDIDGNGTISKFSPEGMPIDLDWITGLNAPKGMALAGSTLHVADVDRVVAINVDTGKVIRSEAIEGAKFLNDVAVDATGTLYVTDTLLGRVYVRQNGDFEVFHDAGSDNRVNGILSVGESLYLTFSNDGTLVRLSGNPPAAEKVASGLGSADGLALLSDGSFLACDWKGRILLVGEDGRTRELLDTRKSGIQAADVDIIAGKSLLLVATFEDNRVVCYRMIGNSGHSGTAASVAARTQAAISRGEAPGWMHPDLPETIENNVANKADGLAEKLDLDKEKAAEVTRLLDEHYSRVWAWHQRVDEKLSAAWDAWDGARDTSNGKEKDELKALTIMTEEIDPIYAEFQPQIESLLTRLHEAIGQEKTIELLDRITRSPGVDRTYQAYLSMIPEMTESEKAIIRARLEQARRDSLAAWSSGRIIKIFKKYKIRNEFSIDTFGYGYRQRYKAWAAGK